MVVEVVVLAILVILIILVVLVLILVLSLVVVCHVVVCQRGTAIDEPKSAGVLRVCSLLSGFRLKSPRAAEPMEGSTSAMKPWWEKDVPTMSRWQHRKYHRHCQRMQNAVHDGQAGNDASNQGFQPVIQVKSLDLPTEAERAADQEVNWTDYYDVEMVDAQVQTLMTADNLGCDETTCTVAAQQPGGVVSLVGEWKPVQLVNLLVGRRVRGGPKIRPTCWLGREGTVRRLPCYPDRWTVDFGKGVLHGFAADELEVQVCEAESYNWHEVVSTASKASQAGTCSDSSSHTGQTAQAIEQSSCRADLLRAS